MRVQLGVVAGVGVGGGVQVGWRAAEAEANPDVLPETPAGQSTVMRRKPLPETSGCCWKFADLQATDRHDSGEVSKANENPCGATESGQRQHGRAGSQYAPSWSRCSELTTSVVGHSNRASTWDPSPPADHHRALSLCELELGYK